MPRGVPSLLSEPARRFSPAGRRELNQRESGSRRTRPHRVGRQSMKRQRTNPARRSQSAYELARAHCGCVQECGELPPLEKRMASDQAEDLVNLFLASAQPGGIDGN